MPGKSLFVQSYTFQQPTDSAEDPIFYEAKFFFGSGSRNTRALAAMKKAGENPISFLRRHLAGDYGDLDQFDKNQNDLAIKEGSRILSSYKTSKGETI